MGNEEKDTSSDVCLFVLTPSSQTKPLVSEYVPNGFAIRKSL